MIYSCLAINSMCLASPLFNIIAFRQVVQDNS